ncbi:MAG: thioredoxin family protein [Chloroflexota bacterium]
MISVDIVEASPERAALAVGASGPSFEGLLGTDGERWGSSRFEDRTALVLIFSSNRCPTAKAYGERMNALQADYAARGVQVIAMNSNDPHLYPDESLPRMNERAAEDGYTFPYLADKGQHVAKAYGAACTFHVFLLDGERRVRYQGRFDDSRIPAKVSSHDLRNALDDVLAGRDVRVATTRPFGCSLDYI